LWVCVAFAENQGTTLDKLISTIQMIEKEHFSMPPDHQQRAAQHFAYKDKNNCSISTPINFRR
jgi:hypothetical protein